MFNHLSFIRKRPACLRKAVAALAIPFVCSAVALAQSAPKAVLKTESFDRDPGWEGHNNRITPERYPTITQSFGYGRTNFAGKSAGEMGGQVTRASEPAYYADRIGPLTLHDKLSAAGTFALTRSAAGAGIFFGFFAPNNRVQVDGRSVRWA